MDEIKKMNILFVYGNRQSRVGGVESWIISLFRTYRSFGHVCSIWWLGENLLDSEAESRSGDLAGLLQFITRRQFDIIHAVTTDWDHGVALVRKVSPSSKLVLTNQLESCVWWNSSNCDALTSCSAWSAAEQQASTDLEVKIVYNGIDTDRFVPSSCPGGGPPIVAWVGRGAALEHKRIDKLAAVAPALCKAGLRLWIADPAGPGGVVPYVAKILSPLAEFWGTVTQDGMPEFLQQVAASGGCVLCTAAYEGLPLSLAEAQACGCPVIATDVRGVNECVDPAHGGRLFDFALSPEDLAQLILDTIGDQEGMARRRIECVKYARERFGLATMATQFLRIYSQLLRPGPCSEQLRSRSKTGSRIQRMLRGAWSASYSQFVAGVRLVEGGEWRLARFALWTSFLTCPSVFVRPKRLAKITRAVMRGLQDPVRGPESA